MPEFHPVANAFPLLTGEAFEELVNDVKAHGCLEAVVMYEGKILDGRNRWRAAQEAGVPHKEITWENLVKRDKISMTPAEWVWAKNAVRRHLTSGQRDMAANKLAVLAHGGDRRSDTFKTSSGGLTRKEIAEKTGASVKGMERAARIERDAVPKVVEAVEEGKLGLSTAERISQMPQEEQEAEVVSITEGRKKRAGGSRTGVGPKVQMTRQLEASSSFGAETRLKLWTENRELITELDSELLAQFMEDLRAERRSIEKLLKLIATATDRDTGTTTAAGAPTTAATPSSPAAKKAATPRKTAARKTAATRKTATVKTTAAQETQENSK